VSRPKETSVEHENRGEKEILLSLVNDVTGLKGCVRRLKAALVVTISMWIMLGFTLAAIQYVVNTK
jgi:hypothetical protein